VLRGNVIRIHGNRYSEAAFADSRREAEQARDFILEVSQPLGLYGVIPYEANLFYSYVRQIGGRLSSISCRCTDLKRHSRKARHSFALLPVFAQRKTGSGSDAGVMVFNNPVALHAVRRFTHECWDLGFFDDDDGAGRLAKQVFCGGKPEDWKEFYDCFEPTAAKKLSVEHKQIRKEICARLIKDWSPWIYKNYPYPADVRIAIQAHKNRLRGLAGALRP